MRGRRAAGASAEARVVEHHRGDAMTVEQRLRVRPVRHRFGGAVKDEQGRGGVLRSVYERRVERTISARERESLEWRTERRRRLRSIGRDNEPVAFHRHERESAHAEDSLLYT